MTSKWRIDRVFSDTRIEKRGQVFTRVVLLVDLYSVITLIYALSTDNPPPLFRLPWNHRLALKPTSFRRLQVSVVVSPLQYSKIPIRDRTGKSFSLVCVSLTPWFMREKSLEHWAGIFPTTSLMQIWRLGLFLFLNYSLSSCL